MTPLDKEEFWADLALFLPAAAILIGFVLVLVGALGR